MLQPELYDTVELLIDLPEYNLKAGMRGALIDQYNDTTFEVEISDENGETLEQGAVTRDQFIIVWRSATHEKVSDEEAIAELMYHLPESKRREVLDFARFLHERRAQYEVKPTATSNNIG
jgi:hypothetical protein